MWLVAPKAIKLKGKILQKRLQKYYILSGPTQARGQDFAKGGGLFLEAGNNSKRTWPKFSSVLNQIEAVFLSKSGDLQKKRSSPKFWCAPEKTTLFWSK